MKTITKPQKNCTYTELPAARRGTDNGSNEHATDFGAVAKLLLENYQTFDVRDALSNSRGLDLPADEITDLFNGWTRRLTRQGKLKKILGCYENPVFKVV